MFSRMVGLGKGLFRSCTLGRALSSSRRKMVANVNTNAMTSKTRPSLTSTIRGTVKRPNTTERGGFISSLAWQ
jgi:hypothetical protein